MSDNKNLPAFPDTMRAAPQSYINQYPENWPTGLTKRELIAAMCLQGLMSNPVYNNPDNPGKLPTVSNFAIAATKYADALLAELSKS